MIVDYPALRQAIAQASQPTRQVPPGYEKDSVCLLLVDRAETMLLAIQKTDSAGYLWRNQIALPGGRIDPADRNARDAALRELHEELGIERSEVEVLGELGHFQTLTSSNDLEVVVGRWRQPSQIHADAREVARVLEVPLANLLKVHLACGFHTRPVSGIGDALVYPVSDVEIWGVTARILHHFLELVFGVSRSVPRP